MKQISKILGVVCTVALSLPACTPQSEPALKGIPSTEADVEAITALYDQYMSTIAEGDVDGYVALWIEDMILMPPNNAIVEGKEAARQWVQSYFDQFRIKEILSLDEIAVSCDWAFARGTYEFQATPKTEGEAIQTSGKIIYPSKGSLTAPGRSPDASGTTTIRHQDKFGATLEWSNAGYASFPRQDRCA